MNTHSQFGFASLRLQTWHFEIALPARSCLIVKRELLGEVVATRYYIWQIKGMKLMYCH